MPNQTETMAVYPDGHLTFEGNEYRCALGKGGVAEDKQEGDGATPAGCYPIREVWYRKDRLGEQTFPFATHVITERDAWGEDPDLPHYNEHTTLDEVDTTEHFWREDHLHDVIVVLGYNDDPVVPGKGSAIFMHVAREGYTPTAGCIALSLGDLLEVLSKATPDTQVCVQA